MKPCPFCGEQIQEVAVKCRYCGEWLDPSRRPASAPTGAEPATQSARTDMSPGTAQSDPARPETAPWSPVFDSTIRGVPPFTLESQASPTPSIVPEGEPPPSSDRTDIGAIQVVGRGPAAPAPDPDLDLDLDLLPSIPSAPAPTFVPEPAAPPEPASAFQARPADQFMQSFLGAPEPGGDLGDDDPFDAAPAPPPPPPWPYIGGLAALAVVLALYVYRGPIFGAGEPSDVVVADATAEPEPEVKPAPPPETKIAEAKPEPRPVPLPAPTDPAFLELLARAKAAYSDGKLKATATALADLSKQAPEHPEVLLLTAQVQLEQGKMAESRTTADRCVELDPDLADCWLTLGVLRQHTKDDAGAVAAYETYLKLAPTGRYARDASSQLTRLKRSAG